MLEQVHKSEVLILYMILIYERSVIDEMNVIDGQLKEYYYFLMKALGTAMA